jgi:hypothetical protein
MASLNDEMINGIYLALKGCQLSFPCQNTVIS